MLLAQLMSVMLKSVTHLAYNSRLFSSRLSGRDDEDIWWKYINDSGGFCQTPPNVMTRRV